MRELFSCRNCIHNAGQSLSVGPGRGYCMKHYSVVKDPADTTCKYQHRKDLPGFVVDESRSEHAAEFASFPGMAALSTKTPVQKVPYSERYCWEVRRFDPVTNALAQYPKAGKGWVFIAVFSGGVGGRRALVHSCLTRRYLHQCDSWTSSYRMILALVDEIGIEPVFTPRELNMNGQGDTPEVEQQARWDVFFSRLTGLQEYGWHAGVEELMWASDGLNGSLAELDWRGVIRELENVGPRWTDMIIDHAKENGGFFTQTGEGSSEPL